MILVSKIQEIIEGCENVKAEKDIHEDAKNLARMVKRDCYQLLKIIEQGKKHG